VKLLESASNSPVTADECATLVADTIPLVMQAIRAEMRSHRTPDLSVPQFRTLAFLGNHPGASISDIAEHIGLTLPSVSKMIDRLEARHLVERCSTAGDRRRVSLELTPQGETTLRVAAAATRARLAEMLAALSPDERAAVARAMHSLRMIFGSGQAAEDQSES
jgi:DNA-binding MarR family transcriptional regulator